MKYLRTKNGIFEFVDTYYMCFEGVETYMYNNKGRGVEINGNQILKQADTIEDLCDEFVNVSKVSKEIRTLGEYHLVESSLNIIKGMSGITYGAIWTSKGLIYVAKMNDKGELELI